MLDADVDHFPSEKVKIPSLMALDWSWKKTCRLPSELEHAAKDVSLSKALSAKKEVPDGKGAVLYLDIRLSALGSK